MNKRLVDDLRRIGFNLALLSVGGIPFCFLLSWAKALMEGFEYSRDVVYMLETGLFWGIVVVPPILLGGLLHQLLLHLIPLSRAPLARRTIAGLFSILVPIVAIVVSGTWLAIVQWFIGPVALTLIAYTAVMRLPPPGRWRSASKSH